MRVRGLKHMNMEIIVVILKSHPMRVRGLKPDMITANNAFHAVAPHAGAWIETRSV